jgi:glucokinase
MTAAATRHIGLDLGATNTKWALLEHAAEWRVLDRGAVATNVSEGTDAVLARLAGLATDAGSGSGAPASVGLGVPGLYDATLGTTTFLPNLPPDWNDLPVTGPLRERIGAPVALINDARAFGLAELHLGAGRGCRTMAGLALGTGVGGVVVIDGRVHFGHNGTGGELGHKTMLPDGPACTCGNRGCLEVFAKAERVAAVCGTSTAAEAVAAARAGDARAIAGLADVGRWLGVAISDVIVVLNPDRVVIGGGVSGAGDLLLEPIRAEVRKRVHVTDWRRVEIVTAELGTWAGAIGAALHGADRRGADPS